jgi:hypothetical protein
MKRRPEEGAAFFSFEAGNQVREGRLRRLACGRFLEFDRSFSSPKLGVLFTDGSHEPTQFVIVDQHSGSA